MIFVKMLHQMKWLGMFKGIEIVSKKLGISIESGKGYRALTNIGNDGGQEVPHLHFHLFGGEKNWENGFMIEKIERYYLEINSINNLKTKSIPSDNFTIKEANKNNFDLNKFFYKQIGKKHQWVDRLIWQDKNWIDYVSNKNLKTFILQKR